MKYASTIRVFSCAIIFAVWAIVCASGLNDLSSSLSKALFLASVAVTATLAELERKHQRDALKEEMRDGRRSRD